MTKTPLQILLCTAALALLAACGKTEDANLAASADSVEMPADELPAGDPSAAGGEEADAAMAGASDPAMADASAPADAAAAAAADAQAAAAAAAAEPVTTPAAPKPAN